MKLAIVTATRAEYGLLTPLIKLAVDDPDIDLDLIVTGTHLAEKHGHTIDFILQDGFPIKHEIPILEEGNDPYDISMTMANAISRFAACFRDDRPDAVVLLGDRTEMLAIACAAMNERIPIVHLMGGSVTEGAVDECVRHALTKMSYLHFTSTEVYRRRVIQLGESPDRVFFSGALSSDNVLNVPLYGEEEIRTMLGIPEGIPYIVATFHPVTLENSAEEQIEELLHAITERNGFYYLFTMANADTGGDLINQRIRQYSDCCKNVMLVSNLGMKKYLSAVKHAAMVLGNSSSGLMEAPVLGTPTVNIGDRQKGRIMAESVVNCLPYCDEIVSAMDKALKIPRKPSLLFGNGHAAETILTTIKKFFCSGQIDLKKKFYDIELRLQ